MAGWHEPVARISIQSGGATRECKYFEAPAVARVPLVKAGSSLDGRISASFKNFSVLSWPPITIIHGPTSLWKHPLPDVWIALIEDGSSTGRTCNRFNCINRWEATAGLTSVLTFHSFTSNAVYACMHGIESVLDLWTIDIKRDSIYIRLVPENFLGNMSGKISINV